MNRIPEYVVTIDEYWLTFLLSTVLPTLVAVVTAKVASSGVKALVLIVLNLITGTLTSLYATGGELELKAAVIGFFVSFVTAVSAHYGFLKPAGVTGSEGAIQRSIPAGLGGRGDYTRAA